MKYSHLQEHRHLLYCYALSSMVNFLKISNTFLCLFSIKMLVIRAGIHKVLVGKAYREDPDQTAFSKAV